ncbi:hypothetical protein LINPERHAP2_LOCUS9629, partial [Linum perenne]
FESFNQALLAKQGWHIFQNPDLLISRLLKGKYYNASNFLDARVPNGASWDWQSLVYGRALLLQGLRWHPGSHPIFNVLEYPWLPGDLTPAFPSLKVPFGVGHGFIR